MNEPKLKCYSSNYSRRDFLGISTAGVLGMVAESALGNNIPVDKSVFPDYQAMKKASNENVNLIGAYGQWASEKMRDSLPAYSFRRKEWNNIEAWRIAAKNKVLESIASPDLGEIPEVKVNKQYIYDGLQVEEITWQLPYGMPTEAIVLKPANSKGRLPGILAFHHHGADKYFGKRKIVRTNNLPHPHTVDSKRQYYDGIAWANEIAKRGYVVLVHDAFPFESRRVLLKEVPEFLRGDLTDNESEKLDNVNKYNRWASEHEDIMAKSLFCAGTSWPGVWVAEDLVALDILCARDDVDADKVGCGGLSGGGMRTVFVAGLDPRVKCAVCVGLMTTWEDFMLNKSHTHTWMTFAPVLPKELDFPEILGLRVPLPTLVLNANEDELFTLPGMKHADEILKAVYKKANAPERYRASFYPGGHKFGKAMQKEAFTWFDKWLK